MEEKINEKTPLPTAERENVEQALGIILHSFEEGIHEANKIKPVLTDLSPDIFSQLTARGYARDRGSVVELTREGERLAKDVTRRRRLAERLLADVLNMEPAAIDPNACQLEHILSPEVAEHICTLLGHPSVCPHGSPIPKGECCAEAKQTVEPIVVSLDHLSSGDRAKITYLLAAERPEVRRLLSLGLIPGTVIRVNQTFPTFVIEVAHTQLALEEEIAKGIFVRKI